MKIKNLIFIFSGTLGSAFFNSIVKFQDEPPPHRIFRVPNFFILKTEKKLKTFFFLRETLLKTVDDPPTVDIGEERLDLAGKLHHRLFDRRRARVDRQLVR